MAPLPLLGGPTAGIGSNECVLKLVSNARESSKVHQATRPVCEASVVYILIFFFSSVPTHTELGNDMHWMSV